jgi:hypothetical protein
MQRRGSLTKSDGMTTEATRPLEDPVPALQDECKRLQLLVRELVLKNHELRSQVTRLSDHKHEFSG